MSELLIAQENDFFDDFDQMIDASCEILDEDDDWCDAGEVDEMFTIPDMDVYF
jgi:hypothetical protein